MHCGHQNLKTNHKTKLLTYVFIGAAFLLFSSCGNLYKDVFESMGGMRNQPEESVHAQVLVKHGVFSTLPERIQFYSDNELTADNFPDWVKEEMGVKIVKTHSLESGNYTNYYYQQNYKGYSVENAVYILHIKNGVAEYANGLLFKTIPVSVSTELNRTEVDRIIQNNYSSVQVSDIEGPVITTDLLEKENIFRFCYKTLVIKNSNQSSYIVYVDAVKKEVFKAEPVGIHLSEPGTGKTRNGNNVTFNTQQINGLSKETNGITVQSFESGYRLFDTIRNIHTVTSLNLSRKKEMFFQLKNNYPNGYKYRNIFYENEVLEEDNRWTQSPAAVEAHWGAAVTYDYFLSNHNRKGMYGNNEYLKIRVNHANNYVGGHYHPYYHYLAFGDGNNNEDPFTELDVVAHEYTHGVTYSYARLNRNGESGSILEGISDAFAIAVEHFQGRGDWLILKKMNNRYTRNASDPNSYQNPDTYKGDYWKLYATQKELDFDLNYGKGSHVNSTVFSYWFYLLTNGGEGENDNEDLFKVEGITMEKAAEIMYTSYQDITPAVTFHQYRESSIAAAKRLFGDCSNEVKQVTNAWYAVGVGDPYCDCFEGSVILHTEKNGEEHSVKLYFKEGKTAAEMGEYIQYTTLYDRYWHLKGYPDLDQYGMPGVMMKNLVQKKSMHLLKQPKRFKTREQYIQYKNKHKTGRTKKYEDYILQEYNLEGTRFWATEDVCLSLADTFGTIASSSSSIKENNRRAFFGFPVEMYYQNTKIWFSNIRDHPVDDSYFSE